MLLMMMIERDLLGENLDVMGTLGAEKGLHVVPEIVLVSGGRIQLLLMMVCGWYLILCLDKIVIVRIVIDFIILETLLSSALTSLALEPTVLISCMPFACLINLLALLILLIRIRLSRLVVINIALLLHILLQIILFIFAHVTWWCNILLLGLMRSLFYFKLNVTLII